MYNFEDLTTRDPLNADGYIAIFRASETHTGFLATKMGAGITYRSLDRFRAAFDTTELRDHLEAFDIRYRRADLQAKAGIIEIVFAVPNDKIELIKKLLDYASQTRVLTDPIVSDMRSFMK